MNKEILNDAIEAMKAQDAFLDALPTNKTPKVVVSVETYEQMINDPKVADDVMSRISQSKDNLLKEVENFINKW